MREHWHAATPDEREQAFQAYLERSAPYVAAVEAAGDEPWHGGDIEAHRVKRPGSGGGSGYWISTRGWSVRFVA